MAKYISSTTKSPVLHQPYGGVRDYHSFTTGTRSTIVEYYYYYEDHHHHHHNSNHQAATTESFTTPQFQTTTANTSKNDHYHGRQILWLDQAIDHGGNYQGDGS